MMVEAFAIMTLARYPAKKAIKEKLWRAHVKLTSIPAADVMRAANEYLTAHPELFTEAKLLAEQIAAAKKPRHCRDNSPTPNSPAGKGEDLHAERHHR
jgi:hypothetical protein